MNPGWVVLDFGSAARAGEFTALVDASGAVQVIKYGRFETFGNVRVVEEDGSE